MNDFTKAALELVKFRIQCGLSAHTSGSTLSGYGQLQGQRPFIVPTLDEMLKEVKSTAEFLKGLE